MSGWILSIVGMVLTVTLAEIMLPEGQTAKYVKGVISLMVVYVVLLPIPTLLHTKFDVKGFFNFSSASYESDPAFIQIIKEDKQSVLSESLTAVFREKGLNSAGVKVILGESENVRMVFLSAEKADLSKAFDLTLSYLGVKEDKIVINEIYT